MYVVTVLPSLLEMDYFLQGTEDMTVHPKYSPLIAALLPANTQKELITVEGGGHDLTLSHSKEINDALLAFFDPL